MWTLIFAEIGEMFDRRNRCDRFARFEQIESPERVDESTKKSREEYNYYGCIFVFILFSCGSMRL